MVTVLERAGTSYLTWARENDIELYRATRNSGKGGRARKANPPETFEWTPELQALAALFSLAQQQIHVTATHGTKAARKKPKITPWPTPRTAAHQARREDSRAAYRTVESMFVFTDDPQRLGYDPHAEMRPQPRRPRSMSRTAPPATSPPRRT